MKPSRFFSEFNCIKERRFWHSGLIDIMFIIAALIFSAIFTYVGEYAKSFAAAFIAVSTYFVTLLIGYSIFKHKVIEIISNKKASRLWFIVFNACFFTVILFAGFILYLLINYFVKYDFQAVYMIVLMGVLVLIGYFLMNIMHSCFVTSRKIRLSYSIFFKSIPRLLLLGAIEVASLLLAYGIYFIFFQITKGGPVLDNIFQILVFIWLIMLNMFNRLFIHRRVELA